MNWVRVFDESRKPAHWTEVDLEWDYVVFVFDATSHVARDEYGQQFPEGEVRVGLCQSLTDAEEFSKALVLRDRRLCCEIYDHEGKAKDPLQTVYHPDVRHQYEGLRYHKREALLGSLAFLFGVSLVVYDFRQQFSWIWGYVIGMKLVTTGGFTGCRGFIGWYERRYERFLT